MGIAGGAVLGHDVDERVGGDLLGQEPTDFARPGKAVRHDEVSYEQAPCRDAIAIRDKVADLTVHFPDRRLCHLRIVAGVQISFGGLGVPELEVRHVDVEDPVE